MPINENQLNTSGLAALAGNKPGYLNLPVARPEMLFKQMDMQAHAREQQNLFNIAQMRNATELAMSQGRNQTEQQMGQNRLAAEQNLANARKESSDYASDSRSDSADERDSIGQRQQQMGAQQDLGQQRLAQSQALAQQKAQQDAIKQQVEAAKIQMNAKSKLTDAERKERGATSGAILQYMNTPEFKALSPDQQNDQLSKLEDKYVKSGVYTPDEAKDFLSSDLATRKVMLMHDVGTTAGGQILAQETSDKDKSGKSGAGDSQIAIDAVGQKKILAQLQNFKDAYAPKLALASSQGQGIIGGVMSKFENILPDSLQSDDYKKTAADLAGAKTALGGLITTVANTMKNGRSKIVQQAMGPMFPTKEDGPGEVIAKTSQIEKFALSNMGVDEDTLNKVPPITASAKAPVESSSTPSATAQAQYAQPGQKYSPADIKAIADHNKMSVEDVNKYLASEEE